MSLNGGPTVSVICIAVQFFTIIPFNYPHFTHINSLTPFNYPPLFSQEADVSGKGYISRDELIEAEFCSFFHPEKCMAQLGVKVV